MTPQICPVCEATRTSADDCSADWMEFHHKPRNVFAHVHCVLALLIEADAAKAHLRKRAHARVNRRDEHELFPTGAA